MKSNIIKSAYHQIITFIMIILTTSLFAQNDLKKISFDFKGYTEHWDKYSWKWYSYNGLFEESQPDMDSELAGMEMNIGNQLILEELWIQKGFVNKLSKSKPVILKAQTSDIKLLTSSLEKGDVILTGLKRDTLIKQLIAKLPQDIQYRRTLAFTLNSQQTPNSKLQTANSLFVIASETQSEADRLKGYIDETINIIGQYKISKGWAGIRSHYLLITQHVHNPFNLINRALQTGCSWITLSGYNDYMLPEPTNKALTEIGLPFTFLPGQYGTGGIMYGSNTFPDVQDNTQQQCLDWMKKNNSYFFGYLSAMKKDEAKQYTGYIVGSSADWAKLDSLKAPYITDAGSLDTQIPSSMILFMNKDEKLDQASVFSAVLERRSVAMFPKADFAGQSKFKNALRILLLDREYLENNFVQPVSVDCSSDKGRFIVRLENHSEQNITAKLKFLSPSSVIIGDNLKETTLALASEEKKELVYNINLTSDACSKELPLGVMLTNNVYKQPLYSVTCVDVPGAVELNPLMIDVPGKIDYPVTVWNYSKNENIQLTLQVKNLKGNAVFNETKNISIPNWQNKTLSFSVSLKQGDYVATVSALGLSQEGQIAIRSQKDAASTHLEDLNNDGIPEIVLENSKIRATIVLFGGRVIEYILKKNNDNLLFKLWPTKAIWDEKPEGRRAFYPYGGLEEFIGYPTIEGHIVFNYKILKDKGDYVRVKVWANIHGSKIEKLITLYGNTELLEVRYAFSDMDENIRIIGINPLIRIGKTTGPEDTYYFPDVNGKIEVRHPVLDRYYGNTFHLKEGWAAGHDSIANLSLLVGYPVNDAKVFHLWNNHPNNPPTPYFYTELQPWLLIKHGTTTYFSYYLMGREGKYQPILNDFRNSGLITTKKD